MKLACTSGRRFAPLLAAAWLSMSSAIALAQATPSPGDAPVEPVSPSRAPVEPPTAAVPPDVTTAELAAQLEALRQAHAREMQALQQRIDELETTQTEATAASFSTVNAASYMLESDPFRIYGFADFGLNHTWIGKHSFLNGIAPSDTTFVLGNLNLYFDFKPSEAWQVLTEIRFSAYPDGVEESFGTPFGDVYTRTSTAVVDVSSPATASKLHWGTIAIERAYAQWTASEKLRIRVGQFLTPYGIWNVDHGTPTLIALMLPHFVAAEAFPARQIGIEASGAFLSAPWEIGYNAYVSNGRTAAQLDFTENKAIGGRLRLSRLRPLPMTFGASIYYGSIDDIEKNITSFAPFTVERDLIVDGHEVGVGADVSLDIDALRIRAEGIMRMTRFEPGKRPRDTFAMPGSFKPDNNEYDSYLLAAYRLPVWGLEPFAYGELNHFVSPYGDEQATVALGLNIHFTPFVQLKTQVARAFFFDLNEDGNFSDNDLTLLFSRLVVAF